MSTSSWLASAAKVPDGVPEKRHLRVGFVALSDAAPLVVAKRLELGHEHGLTLELSRESSWAAVRDKLITGELDAAHSPSTGAGGGTDTPTDADDRKAVPA